MQYIEFGEKDESVFGQPVNIEGTGSLPHVVRYYNTWTGKYSNDKTISSENDRLVLKDIQLEGENVMAVWLKPLEK